MADTLTISSSLNHAVLAGKALEGFVGGFMPLGAVTTDFSDDVGSDGNKITVELTNTAGASEDYDATKGYNPGAYSTQTGTAGAVTITLSDDVTAQYSTTYRKLNSHKVDLEAMLKQKGKELGKKAVDKIFAPITNANYGAAVVTSSAASFSAQHFTDINNALDGAEADLENRFLAIKSTYMNELTQDTTIGDGSKFGSFQATLDGEIPQAFGLKVIPTYHLPGNSENLVGFAGTKEGLVVAQRRSIERGPEFAIAGGVSLPTMGPGGLMFTYRFHVNTTLDELVFSLDWIGGSAVGIPAYLKRIVSA